MIKFYFHPGPNPMKVALFLEESGLPYEVVPVDILKGEQHWPDFLKINPNAKTPALVDGAATVFDSNAILLYLAEKSGQFSPENTLVARGQMLSWLMFVATGIGPYSGQAVHFKRDAPEPKEYALNRYLYEAERHYGILNTQLATHRYMLGDTYTLVDMAVWGWTRLASFVIGENAWTTMPHLQRHLSEISSRPAAKRAEALKERLAFEPDLDAEGRKHIFPQNSRLRQPNTSDTSV